MDGASRCNPTSPFLFSLIIFKIMSGKKNKIIKRTTSLGVNFEHGMNGAVVVYDSAKQIELIIAYLPENYFVNVAMATYLASAFSKNSKKPLTVRRTKNLLDAYIKDRGLSFRNDWVISKPYVAPKSLP